MKKIFTIALALFSAMIAAAQINPNLGNAFADGFTPAELEKILAGVPYKKHEKWMKAEGYTYDKSQSTNEFYYYDKNGVVRFALYHNNSGINQVLAISSPQKFYQALSKLKEDRSYRLVRETVGDNGNGKFMKEAQWVRNGFVFKASSDGYYITVYRDFEGMASKPTIKSFNDKGESKGGTYDLAINNLQYLLKVIGGCYPKAGEDYDGNQRVVQTIKNVNLSGKVEVDKSRLAVDCKSLSKFNVREQVTFDLQDVEDVIIHVYASKTSPLKTYAVCIIVKNWDKNGIRRYDIMQTSSGKCSFTNDWKTGRRTSSYVRPFANTAIAFEFTDEKWAKDTKAFLDLAVKGVR